jgi:hypothetical protein
MRVLTGLIIAFIVWICVALYIMHQRQPEVILIEEVDAGPGMFPLQAEDQAAPHMLISPCPLTPQNVPVVDPERTA